VRIATAVLAVVTALVLVGCGGDDNGTTTEATLSPEQKIEQTGNEWASLFAADHEGCKLMTQPACERIACERVGGFTIENCTPPSSDFRKSFRDATVQDIAIKGEQAAAKFSNGEAVELVHIPGPDLENPSRLDAWWIHRIGGNAGDVQFITKVGNEWAPLFAKDTPAACRYMFAQPVCEKFFGRPGETQEEVIPPSGFQTSFANATVERVEIKGHKAGAKFSNGELVEFIQETQEPRSLLGDWFILDVGGNAGKKYFEP
jgi:hypothetical protein